MDDINIRTHGGGERYSREERVLVKVPGKTVEHFHRRREQNSSKANSYKKIVIGDLRSVSPGVQRLWSYYEVA